VAGATDVSAPIRREPTDIAFAAITVCGTDLLLEICLRFRAVRVKRLRGARGETSSGPSSNVKFGFRRLEETGLMADNALPYLNASGNITKVLGKIKDAETPTRFSQDYLATTLQMPGGSAKPLIPFLKRTGFLASDGSPTDLYRRFRGAESGAAAADALRLGYKPIYRINEYAHDATDAKLKDLIVQATGAQKGSKTVGAIASSFKAVKAFADFSAVKDEGRGAGLDADRSVAVADGADQGLGGGIQLGYTINLHLPPTPDVAVFDAIFRSLKEHLIR
jgi:hypothetical protein